MERVRKDGEERRDALLDAALACATRHGVLGAGIEAIRKEAGASPSSVYHFFRDANDVRTALLTRTFERLFAHLVERVLTTKSAREAVQTLVAAHIDWILAHRDEGRFMYAATALEMSPDASAAIQKRKAALLAPMVKHLEVFVREGKLPKWSPLQLDVVLLGASHEALRRHLAGAPVDARWMRETLPALAWKSIRAK